MEILGLQRHWVFGKRMSLGMWEEFMEELQLYIPVWITIGKTRELIFSENN